MSVVFRMIVTIGLEQDRDLPGMVYAMFDDATQHCLDTVVVS